MKYNIPAKPTKYNGRLYRSRLEARWAAFFDILKIPFEYEPFDLNGWSPDFSLEIDNVKVLVEVKPGIEDFDMPKMLKAILKNDEWALMLCTANATESLILFHNGYQLNYFNSASNTKSWVEAGNRVMFLKPE